MLLHRNGLNSSLLKANFITGQTTTTEKTSTCPVEGLHKSWRRERSTVGTLRLRITSLEKSRAGADPLLATLPRLCGKEALRLELASHRKAARWLLWQTILPLATLAGSMLRMFLHPSRGGRLNTSVDF